MEILDTLKRPWVFNLILSCLFSHLPSVWLCASVHFSSGLLLLFSVAFLPSLRPSGPVDVGLHPFPMLPPPRTPPLVSSYMSSPCLGLAFPHLASPLKCVSCIAGQLCLPFQHICFIILHSSYILFYICILFPPILYDSKEGPL